VKVQENRVQRFWVQGFKVQEYRVQRFSIGAGLKSVQPNRRGNFEKANTRLPCIVRWVAVIIEL
jgi:hypothetical protein